MHLRYDFSALQTHTLSHTQKKESLTSHKKEYIDSFPNKRSQCTPFGDTLKSEICVQC